MTETTAAPSVCHPLSRSGIYAACGRPRRNRDLLDGPIYWAQIFLVALLFLSQVGIRLFTINERYFFEPMLLLLFLLSAINPKLRRSLAAVLGNRSFHIGAAVALCLTAVGMVRSEDVIGPYADFRACLALLFCFFLVSTKVPDEPDKLGVLVHLALSTIFIDIASMFIWSDPGAKRGCSIIACALVLYLAGHLRKPWLFLLASSLSAGEAILSFYRTYWLVVAASYILFGGLMTTAMIRRREIQRTVIILVVVSFGLVNLYQTGIIGDYFFSSEARYVQSIGKTKDLISTISDNTGAKKGDDLRFGYFQFIVEYPLTLMLPHGLGSRSVFGDIDPYFYQFSTEANTADSGVFYLAFHFGIILTALLVGYLVHKLRIRLKKVTKLDAMFVLSALVVFGIYLVPVGDLFVVIPRGAFAGAFLATILSKNLPAGRSRPSF